MSHFFRFKQFSVEQTDGIHKLGTDSVLLGAWADCHGAKTILDIGTGTGILALMLAQRYEQAHIWAIEINPTAADYALRNFRNSPWTNRLHLIQADFFDYQFSQKFDCIVTNPPYFPNFLKSRDKALSLARHGLDFSRLAQRIAQIITSEAKINLVIAHRLHQTLEQAFNQEYLFCERKSIVFTTEHKPPQLVLFKFLAKITQCIESNFYLRTAEGPTEQYRKLVGDFYLHLT